MQASVAAEIRWRLGLYEQALGMCRRGGFSFARFLALVPERLRLASGDHADRIRISVAVAPPLRARIESSLPSAAEGVAVAGPAEVRRFVRLAQVHPDIDARALRGWLGSGAPRLLEALARVHGLAMAEVGRGEGGIEAAYLAHLTMLATLRRALDAAHAGDGARALVAALAPSALARAADGMVGGGASLPARFGMQTELTTSIDALGVEPRTWARLPANPRRTIEAALELARRVVAPPFETMPIPRVVDTVARRLLADKALRQALAKDLLVEQVRDALLLFAASGTDAESRVPLDLVSSSRALGQAIFVSHRRTALLEWLAAPGPSAHRAAGALRARLEGAERVEAGDLSPLGVHGDLTRRAELAAQGAVLAALDGHAERLRGDVTRMLHFVPDAAQYDLHSAGRCYRFALDELPLYNLPDTNQEGALSVDLSAVTASLARWPARRAAGLLDRHLIGPLLGFAARMPGVFVAGVSAERVHLRGEIEGLAEVAQFMLRESEGLRQAVLEGADDVFGGIDEVAEARRSEQARVDARLVELDLALSRVSGDAESVRLLSDSKALLEAQRKDLEASTASYTLEGPVVSMALTFGELAEVLDSDPRIAVSAPLTEGIQRLRRSEALARARAARVAMTKEARGGGDVKLSFRVAVAGGEGGDLHNTGCVISRAALDALAKAVAGARTSVRRIELRNLSSGLRARTLFERDPEELWVLTGADGAPLHAARWVAEFEDGELWELLSATHEVVAECFGGGSQ